MVNPEEESNLLLDYCQRFRRDDPTLTICHLHGISIGNGGAQALAEALEHSTKRLVVLFADNCDIGDAGAEALARTFKKQTALRYVYLSYNYIGNRGAKALAEVLQSSDCRLAVLKLGHNNIGDAGAIQLAQALPRCPLKTLDLSGNGIQLTGQGAVADALRLNTRLETLSLQYNLIESDDQQPVRERFLATLTRHNTTLKILQLDPPNNCAIEYFLSLNRLGRHSFGQNNIPKAAWTRVLAKANKNHTLYALLQARPDLIGA